jgi:DNA-directed RNA polymerase II subunit RPB1
MLNEKIILTDVEKDTIVNKVFLMENTTSIPSEINESILKVQKQQLYFELGKIQIYPSMIPNMIQSLRDKYIRSQIAPGESIGILCAQSIGERQTQMTLNTFHAAGMTVDMVVTGVPRFLELLNASKEPKMSSSKCLVKSQFQDLHEMKKILSKQIIDIKIRDLYTYYDICINEKENYPYWYDMYKNIYKQNGREKIFENTKYFVRYTLSNEALYRYNLYMYEIVDQLHAKFDDICCICSPNYEGILDIYMDLTDISLPTERTHEIIDDDDENTSIDINPDRLLFLTDENKDLIYIEEVFIPHIETQSLFGIPNIKDYFIEKKGNQFMIHTKGNNFAMLLSCPYLCSRNTISNNMWNINETLGIEATREFLIDEFMNIVSADGTFINSCHIELLVDIMTFSGTITSISRYGMKNDTFGALAKASFEESLDNFLKAGFFSELETTKDVSASIICGKRPNVGTGLCKILLDIFKMI